ncbi:GTPase [uncultured Psychrobacter sp.]|uniref:GTPase n=1 Tax=uncultured Psychrobacter sp. TaxID=259303 RepID=UPI003457A43B
MDNLEKRYKKAIKNSEVVLKQGNTLLQAESEGMSKPVVVAWGLMNAGKSYLLNMLTEHIDNEYFKTNDFRETAEVKKFETDDFVFLDTPGLDASIEDNLTAMKGVGKADIVLFVHQLQGELEAVEIEFLQNLVNSFGEYASDNIIIVLSKVDKEDDRKVEDIRDKVLQQCEIYIGFEPKCITVSNTVYKAGTEKNVEGLIKISNIERLHDLLQKLSVSVQGVRAERQLQQKQQLIKQLKEEKKQLDQVLSKYKEKASNIEADAKSFNSTMKKLKSFMVGISKEHYKLEMGE